MELGNKDFRSVEDLAQFIVSKLDYLVTSRPTAVNMKEAAIRFSGLAKKLASDGVGVDELQKMFVITCAINELHHEKTCFLHI